MVNKKKVRDKKIAKENESITNRRVKKKERKDIEEVTRA